MMRRPVFVAFDEVLLVDLDDLLRRVLRHFLEVLEEGADLGRLDVGVGRRTSVRASHRRRLTVARSI